MPAQSLEQFVQEVGGESHLRIEHDYGDGFVRLRTSEAERRQAAQDIRCTENIVLELLRNSRDAHASNVFLALSREGRKRTIVSIDDGDGIPQSMHVHVFEPRVTSKLDTSHIDAWGMHGRGMALYSIKENATDACVVQSTQSLGCVIRVQTDLDKLGEKADQSSFPTFFLDEDATVHVRGPKNILRTACEFAIEERSHCSVYVGSPTEIAATVYAYGLSTLSSIDRVFCEDANALPIVKRLATCADPESFATCASHLGLEISSRSARRILDGDIDAIPHLLDRVSIVSNDRKESKNAVRKARPKRPTVKLSSHDKEHLSDGIKDAFSDIAHRYYLEQDVKPGIKVHADHISVTIPLCPEQ